MSIQLYTDEIQTAIWNAAGTSVAAGALVRAEGHPVRNNPPRTPGLYLHWIANPEQFEQGGRIRQEYRCNLYLVAKVNPNWTDPATQVRNMAEVVASNLTTDHRLGSTVDGLYNSGVSAIRSENDLEAYYRESDAAFTAVVIEFFAWVEAAP